jgi:hypothetical protein
MSEAMAAQALFVGLCNGLMKLDPANERLVRYAFEYADHVAELGAYKFGGEGAEPYLTGFAKILEQLRAATLPDHGQPQDAV